MWGRGIARRKLSVLGGSTPDPHPRHSDGGPRPLISEVRGGHEREHSPELRLGSRDRLGGWKL